MYLDYSVYSKRMYARQQRFPQSPPMQNQSIPAQTPKDMLQNPEVVRKKRRIVVIVVMDTADESGKTYRGE
jgi:hypothetical protein